MVLTGADIFAEVLVEQGVETLFGYPGGSVLNLYDALFKYSGKIRLIMTAHEQGAHSGDGYAPPQGKTGVVLATSGPERQPCHGHRTAYMDSIPMVAITVNVGTSLIGGSVFQEVIYRGHYDAHNKA
jgi:acetolactate synthase-1/2/3 large subunit